MYGKTNQINKRSSVQTIFNSISNPKMAKIKRNIDRKNGKVSELKNIDLAGPYEQE